MGDLIPFRRRRRKWTRPNDYGHVLPTNRWRGAPIRSRSRLLHWLTAWRPFLLFFILALIWNTLDPALMEPPDFLSTAPEQVETSFTICGEGSSEACVIDGDTFRLGQRSIRLVGLDAPETHPSRCEAEAQLGGAATERLVALLNLGPFEMRARIDEQYDRYGRELLVLTRIEANGNRTSIANEMLASGTVRRYLGGLRGDWC
jgi:micrococcal nuclease